MKHLDVDLRRKMVAEVYVEAEEAGMNPTDAIAETWGCTRNTATRWIFMARQAGYLAPARHGRRPNNVVDDRCLGLYEAGLTLEQIGEELGVSRQRVQQRLARLDPAATARRRENQRQANRLNILATRGDRMTLCRVCDGEFEQRGSRVTCSQVCRIAYRLNRYWFNQDGRERQRRASAMCVLRHPERYEPRKVRWAENFLAAPKPPNRSCRRNMNAASWLALVDAVGEERAAAITRATT